ncbi:MAG: rhodanese-like domain-containing protein [Gammaproteobacteria bacterium]|nr:MAG: rhodanese-like domain-containing protein [Gammaproteobacteria bacterium]RLA23830.1 MAG: rhodanese-like domain-containing protein [Gammaproteobacteria bacterium]
MSDEKIKRLSPLQSFKLLETNPDAVLIDVRTSAEIKFLGGPVGSVSVPWMEFPEMKPLPDFVENVRQQVGQTKAPLLLICRSGQRSMSAAKALAGAGFSELINVEEGFEGDLNDNGRRNLKNGWRFHGLPWQQK